jgi:hypothetical protein
MVEKIEAQDLRTSICRWQSEEDWPQSRLLFAGRYWRMVVNIDIVFVMDLRML